MILVGLTGGIGSGKSTVSTALAAKGAIVADADAIVRDLQRPGQVVFSQMVDALGADIVGSDGQLDRQHVADLVFNNEEALATLSAIVHPAVANQIQTIVAESTHTNNVVILDIPLLAESGWNDQAGTVVVDIDPTVAEERLVTRRGFSQQDARRRMANQMSREDRLSVADYVVDNNGSLDELHEQMGPLWEWINQLARYS